MRRFSDYGGWALDQYKDRLTSSGPLPLRNALRANGGSPSKQGRDGEQVLSIRIESYCIFADFLPSFTEYHISLL